MFFKYVLFPCTILYLLFAVVIFAQAPECPLKYNCPTTEKPVWGSDSQKCHIFLNKCFLANENCERMNNHLPMLKLEDGETCRKKCPKSCPTTNAPVCAIYRDKLHTFRNQCFMDEYACKTRQPWHYLFAAECDAIFFVERKQII